MGGLKKGWALGDGENAIGGRVERCDGLGVRCSVHWL